MQSKSGKKQKTAFFTKVGTIQKNRRIAQVCVFFCIYIQYVKRNICSKKWLKKNRKWLILLLSLILRHNTGVEKNVQG